MVRTALLWGLTSLLWLVFRTGVLRADDKPVAASSQVAPERRWNASAGWERPPPPLEAAEDPERIPDYTGWLITGYLSVPVLAVGIPVLWDSLSTSGEMSAVPLVLGTTTAILTPGLVHFIHGESGLGARAWGGMAVAAIGGGLVGFGIGYAIGSPHNNPEDGNLPSMLYGALAGGITISAAVIAWSIYDVLDTSERASDPRAETASVRFAVVPQPSGGTAAVFGRF